MNSMNDVDFSPLTSSVTLSDWKQYRQWRTKTGSSNFGPLVGGALVILIIALFVGSGLFSSLRTGSSAGSFTPILLTVGFIAIIVAAAGFAYVFSLKERIRVYKFASLNQIPFTIDRHGSPHEGVIFSEGYAHILKELMILPGEIELGNYQYETGSGKSHQTHQWAYVHFELPRRLPHMILDAKSNNIFGKITNLPSGFSRSQILSLEGNFDQYFTLYAPEQYRTDALYIFTPDVMAAMIDKARHFDVEIIDNHMMLYVARIKLSDPAALQSIADMVGVIRAELNKQGARYADERVGNRAVDTIAQPGLRLKRGMNIWIFVMVGIFILYNIFPTIISFFTHLLK